VVRAHGRAQQWVRWANPIRSKTEQRMRFLFVISAGMSHRQMIAAHFVCTESSLHAYRLDLGGLSNTGSPPTLEDCYDQFKKNL